MLRKLEIYTFASAADHFSRARPTKRANNVHCGVDGLFGRVEHFANEGDFVAQYGVLNPDVGPNKTETELETQTELETLNEHAKVKYGRFTGRIITRQLRNGHSLLGH
jgi:hypothetical protein